MYKPINATSSLIKVNDQYIGETIEQKVRRVTKGGEPIEDGAEKIYTERKDGVRPEYDIRTDRFELAIDATDYMTASKLASREERIQAKKESEKPKSIGGTGDDIAA